jgi:UDPglucose 6-dehydrogenase
MKHISIVGSGHVGLVTGACLAELGNRVICMDDDSNRIDMLKKEDIPFYEPGRARKCFHSTLFFN